MVYLDNAATTKVCESAQKAVVNAMQNDFGNPSSLYRLGLDAENIVTESARTIAQMIGCDFKEILFTSGATESNNTAILGAVSANKRAGNKIVVSAIEHPSVYEVAKALEQDGFEVEYIYPRDDGSFYPEDFAQAVDDKTIIVSCMLVNNENGALLPIERIAKAVKRKSPTVLMHTDAVQAFGKIPVNVKKLSVDLMSISGHKIYAPKGIGALYIKKGTKIKPLLFGGGQQNNMRVGTEPVPMISALAESVRELKLKQASNLAHYTRLKEYFLESIKDIDDIEYNVQNNSIPYIVSFSVDRIKSEVLLHFLEQKEIYVSSGSACSKGKKSRVLKAFGASDMKADTTLRISFSEENTTDDIDKLLENIKIGIESLAKLK